MSEPAYKRCVSPVDKDSAKYAPEQSGLPDMEHAVYIENLKNVNEELRQARRAALNLMEDAIASKEALRKSEEKYRTLFDSMDEGYCIIQMMYNDDGKPFNWRYLQVNSAFELHNGLHNAEGKTILDMAPDIEPKWMEIYHSVAQTGEPLRFEEDSAALKRNFSLYAFRIGSPHEHKIAVIFSDISERKKAESSLRESEERKAFLLELSDNLRSVTGQANIQETVARFAMDHFTADRCYYCEMKGDKCIIGSDAIKEGLLSLAGEYALDDLPLLKSVIHGEKPLIVHDIHTTDLIDESLVKVCAQRRLISFIDIPVIKNGKPVAIFCIVQTTPRNWKDFEVELVQETAERSWSAIEKAKIEEAAREEEERKEFLLRLNDTIRQLEDPVEIQYEASRLVAEQLKVDRVHFAELSDDAKLVIRKDYVRSNDPSVAGVFKLQDSAAALKLNRDEPVVIADTNEFPLLSEEEKAAFAAAKIRSQLSVALSKMGKKVASFSVDQTTPRQWTPLDISILQEAAERTWSAVERAKAEEALRESEAMLAKELEDTKTLQKIGSRIIEEGNVQALYEALISSAKDLMHADGASIQILQPETDQLLLAASQGFHPLSAEFWKYVAAGSGTSCGKALETTARVVVPDVDDWNEISKKDLDEYHRSGIVATQSTPLISRSGKCLGMMSTHWKRVYQPSERKLGLFELLTRQVADVIEKKQAEDALWQSKERLQRAIQIETVGVIFFNDDNIIVEANDAFLKMTRFTAEQVGHVRLEDITPPEWIPSMKNAIEEILGNGIATPYERELIRADGSRFWALCAKARISENDNIEYIIDVTKRREAEDALRQNEQRFRTLTNAVPQVIWTNDAKGKANFFNERWYKYSGLNYEESVGLGWEAIVHPDDAPASKEIWHKALAEGKIFDTEYRLRRHDDVYRWHIGRNIPLKNNEDKIIGWFGSATEIEELKQTENALRESEAKMKITFESATDFAIITIDKDCHIESWNSGAEKIFGYSEQEIKGKSCDLIFTPEDIADHVPAKEMKHARETGHAADDRWHIRRNGERFFMSGVTSPIYDNDGLSGYVKVARDMTQQRSADENLRIWEERYRIALLSAEMGAWDWSIPEDKLIWNEQQYVLLGLHPDNKAKSLEDFLAFIHEPDKERVIQGLQVAREDSGVFQMEFRIRRQDNDEIRWINKFGLVVTKKDKRPARMIGVMYDITQRKRLEQQKEDFIGIASHELKTPVTSIKAYAELLQQMYNEDDYVAGAPLVLKLNKQVDRLIELVHALLDITKMAEGDLPLHIEAFNLKKLAEECVESLQRMASCCRIILRPKKELFINGDRERISQVLINLISNAVKYSPGGGDIIINWKKTPEGIVVSVKDEGIGISKEMQAKVFERFFRVNDVKSNTFPGMGLGLFITTNIVQRHGGKIWMESEPGKGSVFYFTLPDKIQRKEISL